MEQFKNTTENQLVIPLARSQKGKLARILAPKTDEPIRVIYMPTGWDYGFPTFHVIIEFGDYESVSYEFMSLAEMVKKFNVTEEEILQDDEYIISSDAIRNNPNDQELGELIRKKLYHQS